MVKREAPRLIQHLRLMFIAFRWVYSILCFVMGPPILIGSTLTLSEAVKSKQWPITAGTILDSAILEYPSGGRGKGFTYVPVIRYKYRVGANTYTSKNITLADCSEERELAQAEIAKFPAGINASVFYDPNHPEHAILEPGPNKMMVCSIAIAIGAILSAIIMCPVTNSALGRIRLLRRFFEGLPSHSI